MRLIFVASRRYQSILSLKISSLPLNVWIVEKKKSDQELLVVIEQPRKINLH